MKKLFFLLLCSTAGMLLGLALFAALPLVTDRSHVSAPNDNTLSTLLPQPVKAHYSKHSYYEGIARAAPAVVSLYSSETIYRAPNRNAASDDSLNPIIAPRERRSTSQGSGVIIDSNGIVLTNLHLIEDADEINIVLGDGSLHRAIVLGSDAETDIAVVKIDATDLPAVSINSNAGLRVGDIVLAIGNPFGVGQTVTSGIVSAMRRRVAGASAWQNFVQIDAAINPGNSGGALINPDGELVGINTAVFLRDNNAEGIGFAIPVDLLSEVVPQIIENDHVMRGWLGIGADDLQMFPSINREVERGAVITGVLRNSPAERGGLLLYDVVTHVAEQPINNATELLLLISALPPKSKVSLKFLRNGVEQTAQVTLLERPLFDR